MTNNNLPRKMRHTQTAQQRERAILLNVTIPWAWRMLAGSVIRLAWLSLGIDRGNRLGVQHDG